MGGVSPQIVRDWIVRFNAQGAAGLINGRAPGPASKLTDEHRRALAKKVDDGSDPAVHGVVRWRLKDLVAWLAENHGPHARRDHGESRSEGARLSQAVGPSAPSRANTNTRLTWAGSYAYGSGS